MGKANKIKRSEYDVIFVDGNAFDACGDSDCPACQAGLPCLRAGEACPACQEAKDNIVELLQEHYPNAEIIVEVESLWQTILSQRYCRHSREAPSRFYQECW